MHQTRAVFQQPQQRDCREDHSDHLDHPYHPCRQTTRHLQHRPLDQHKTATNSHTHTHTTLVTHSMTPSPTPDPQPPAPAHTCSVKIDATRAWVRRYPPPPSRECVGVRLLPNASKDNGIRGSPNLHPVKSTLFFKPQVFLNFRQHVEGEGTTGARSRS